VSQSRIGRELGGRFKVIAPLGEGDVGVVYSADDRTTGRRAAVRFLKRELLEDQDFLARFHDEARRAEGLGHVNLAAVLASGEDEEGIPWLASEYVGGRTLRKAIEEEGPLSYDRSAGIAAQVLRALAAAEGRGLVHRNLRPENIRLEPAEGAVERVRVLDYGVVRRSMSLPPSTAGDAEEAATGLISEVSCYLAPEQILGEAAGSRANLYSVGVLLYEMLTGTTPFPADTTAKYASDYLTRMPEPPHQRARGAEIPPGLEKLVLDLLARRPEDRPAGASAAADLADAFAVREIAAPVAAPPARGHFLAYLGGGILGGGSAAVVSGDFAFPAAAAGLGLGIGATAAFRLFPRIGELHSWIRLVLCAVVIAGAGAAAHMKQGGEVWLSLSYPLAALLALSLYAVGWGRRKRLLAVVLGALVAPAAAFLLLPVPTGREFVFAFSLFGGAALDPLRHAAAASLIGFFFGLSGLFAPLAVPKRGIKG
jgi:serine/threonine-protein kinase